MIEEYLKVLQIAGVIGVACVLLVGACADLFASEVTGINAATGKDLKASKYRGALADWCRRLVFLMGGFMAIAYTVLCGAVAYSVWIEPGYFDTFQLNLFIAVTVTTIIVTACWLTMMITLLRNRHMHAI